MPITNRAMKTRSQKASRLANRIAADYPQFNRKQLLQQAYLIIDAETHWHRAAASERAIRHGKA